MADRLDHLETMERARAGLAVLELARETLERASTEAGGDQINVQPALNAIGKQSARLLRAYDRAKAAVFRSESRGNG